MAASSSGLFTLPEFVGRNVIKLAPDSFIAINTEVGAKFLAPVSSDGSSSGYKSLDVRGGVTSININAAVSPPGASRANIEIIAPIYKGLHEDYYYTLPNGTRKSVFQPMMEIKVYLKGLKLRNGNPIYYPAFWGFISGISETYSGGVFNIALTCSDLLSWWNYQKISVIPNVLSGDYAAPSVAKFPTVFENMNPWQIIYNLFYETGWKDDKGKRFDWIYPKLSNIGTTAYLGDLFKTKENTKEGVQGSKDKLGAFFMALAENSNEYWRNRMGFGRSSSPNEHNRIQLEMFGMLEEVNLNNPNVATALSYNANNRQYQQATRAEDLYLNFNLVSQVQPYGAFNIYDGGSSGLENTKLEIATEVCAQTEMEFYLDTNGTVVFKPPFYNMDVENSSTDTYTIKPKDIINFSNDVNTDSICTYLEVYGPREQFDPSLDSIGYHIDFDLIKKFGLRYQKLDLRYGNTPDQIRLLAAAKMAKINGRAFTGSVSIPMRPEIRLGYPVYISHIDAYYYVTGINHSFSFGSAATTTLSLEFRRDRVFSDGSVKGTSPGDVLDGYVYRYTGKNDPMQFAEQKIDDSTAASEEAESKTDIETALGENDVKKWESLRDGNVISGPRPSGLYEIDKGKLTHALSGTGKEVVQSNELIMLSFPKSGTDSTGESVPFTDLRGYRHIGAFPYGANLSLVDKDTRAADLSAPTEKSKQEAAAVTDAAPASSTGSPSSPGASDEPMHFDGININPEESLTDPDGGPIETSWLAYRAEEAAKSNKNSQEVKEQVDERRRPDFNKMPTNGSKLNAYRSFKAATPLRKTEDGSSLEKTNSIITNSGISN